MAVFKIFRSGEWASFQEDGVFLGSADDLRDGFIHLSDGEQVAGTLAKHFAGEFGLVLAEVNVEDDAALRWDVSRGGARFPHLFRALRLDDVVGTADC